MSEVVHLKPAEMERELHGLLCLERTIQERLSSSNANISRPPPPPELFTQRSVSVALLLRIKHANPALFRDPILMHLAITYVDCVLWSDAHTTSALKTSPAMPLACLLIAMKVIMPLPSVLYVLSFHSFSFALISSWALM
jgi:hypothetical protein